MDDFWGDYIDGESTGPALTDEMVRAAERTLGVTLPESYLQLLRVRNGGYPQRQCFPAPPNSWADDHVRIETLMGVGYPDGIDGLGRFDLRDRGCPDPALVVIADTPSGGHDFVVLDYRETGPHGEPRVSHVETEGDVGVLVIAPDFATFARGLVDCAPYDEADAAEEPAEPARRRWWQFWR